MPPNISFPKLLTYRYSSSDVSKRFSVENPATGQILTTIQAGDTRTVHEAVRASQLAFATWSKMPPSERATYLEKCATELEKHADELAETLTLENGKPYPDARQFDVNFLVGCFRFFAGIVDALPSQFYDRGSMYCTVVHEPVGVCVGILPFNWPPIHSAGKTAPCLAAGNTMILKPGDQAPLTVLKIVEICRGVLPEGVLEVVPGVGTEVPQALVEHPGVKMVSFTGSTAAGKKVAETAARGLKKCVLELGGKNAMVVFGDADLGEAVRWALNGGFFNKGEACTATSRLLVQRGVYEEFVQRLGEAVRNLKVGDGMDPSTHVGPQVSRAQQQRVLNYIALGEKEEGARIVAQAALPSDPTCKEGFFVPPTLFGDVTPEMRIAQEEMFGPVVTATSFGTYEEAVCIVNSSEYGLTCAVFTQDALKMNRMARDVEVGMVFANHYNRSTLGVPFGGVKESGYGREHCIETLYEWTQTKAIHSISGRGEVPQWRAVKDILSKQKSEIDLPDQRR